MPLYMVLCWPKLTLQISVWTLENLSGLNSAVVPLSVIFSFKNDIVHIICDKFTSTNQRH